MILQNCDLFSVVWDLWLPHMLQTPNMGKGNFSDLQ